MLLPALLLTPGTVTTTAKLNFDLLPVLFEPEEMLSGFAVELTEQNVALSAVESRDDSLVHPIHNLDHSKLIQRA